MPESISFKSKHYPTSGKRFVMVQKHAQKYYNTFAVLILITAVLMMLNQQSPLYWTLVLGMIGLFFANLLGSVQLSATVAEIFIVNEHFYVMSVNDILRGGKIPSYPLEMAHFQWNAYGATIHYHDRVIQLYSEDWEEWNLLSKYLQPTPAPRVTFQYEYVEKNEES